MEEKRRRGHQPGVPNPNGGRKATGLKRVSFSVSCQPEELEELRKLVADKPVSFRPCVRKIIILEKYKKDYNSGTRPISGTSYNLPLAGGAAGGFFFCHFSPTAANDGQFFFCIVASCSMYSILLHA